MLSLFPRHITLKHPKLFREHGIMALLGREYQSGILTLNLAVASVHGAAPTYEHMFLNQHRRYYQDIDVRKSSRYKEKILYLLYFLCVMVVVEKLQCSPHGAGVAPFRNIPVKGIYHLILRLRRTNSTLFSPQYLRTAMKLLSLLLLLSFPVLALLPEPTLLALSKLNTPHTLR